LGFWIIGAWRRGEAVVVRAVERRRKIAIGFILMIVIVWCY
jgi:hypothetical protein